MNSDWIMGLESIKLIYIGTKVNAHRSELFYTNTTIMMVTLYLEHLQITVMYYCDGLEVSKNL